MTRRAWLPRPAIPPPPRQPCGQGRPFASEDLARAALMHGLAPVHLTPTRCSLGCGGWHNEPRETT